MKTTYIFSSKNKCSCCGNMTNVNILTLPLPTSTTYRLLGEHCYDMFVWEVLLLMVFSDWVCHHRNRLKVQWAQIGIWLKTDLQGGGIKHARLWAPLLQGLLSLGLITQDVPPQGSGPFRTSRAAAGTQWVLHEIFRDVERQEGGVGDLLTCRPCPLPAPSLPPVSLWLIFVSWSVSP